MSVPDQLPAWAGSAAARKRFADLPEFIRLVETADLTGDGSGSLFGDRHPLWLARAPGRLDVMGGIADYSGSLVLQLPIAEATYAAAQEAEDGCVRVVSLSERAVDQPRVAALPVSELAALADVDYAVARDRLRRRPQEDWAAYVLGVFVVLAKERRRSWPRGARLLVWSRVPEAKGVSSSAALEVAAMRVVCQLIDEPLDGVELARLCQLVENRVVGAPCGIMDQMTSALGRSDQLLALLCQPADVQGFLPIARSIEFWGLDSGIRHAVSGSDYTAVRTGAFMGYRIIADLAELPVAAGDQPGVVRISDSRWRGYLANLAPGEYERNFADRLPETMRGAEFLDHFAGTTDAVTSVQPQRIYAVRQPTAHPIYEHARVRRFGHLLSDTVAEPTRIELGQLMYASHASYSACGLGSDGTDRLVELVRAAGPASGLYGAKITGGGSGGTVAVLARAGSEEAVRGVADQYRRETGRDVFLFHGSSDGAFDFPDSQWL